MGSYSSGSVVGDCLSCEMMVVSAERDCKHERVDQ